MSDQPRAMEGMVLPEWGIHLRNLIDRMAPVVNDHHRDIDALKQTVARLEQIVAKQQQTIGQQSSTIGALQARALGTGSTVGSD